MEYIRILKERFSISSVATLLIGLLLGMRLLLVGFHRLEGLGISRHPLLGLLNISLLRIRILLHRILPRICLIALLAPGGRISVGRLTVIHPCSDPFRNIVVCHHWLIQFGTAVFSPRQIKREPRRILQYITIFFNVNSLIVNFI